MALSASFVAHCKKLGIPQGKKLELVAVSGGVDSMVLAHLLHEHQIPFAVAHCNFQLRGVDAAQDEAMVAEWCRNRDIRLHLNRFDTQQVADHWKKGIQETARILRYDWFKSIMTQEGYGHLLTAHHLDDTVETVLMNLFRGTGIAGLHGIPPTNEYIRRPLLFATKAQIRQYATDREVPFREDSSNDTDDYSRNLIRRQIIPVIEQHFPNASRQISETAERVAEAETLYQQAIAQERKKLLEQRGNDFYIPVRKLQLRRPLPTICRELTEPFGFSTGQLPQIIALLEAESGHYVSSSTHRVIKNREFLIITALPDAETDFLLIEDFPYSCSTPHHTYHFMIADAGGTIDPDKDKAYLDLDQIQQPLILRKWKTGDYLYPIGMEMKKKKVSRMLINDKVPLHEKERIWVLESDKRIAWIAGMRMDERFKVKPTTRQVLIVSRVAL